MTTQYYLVVFSATGVMQGVLDIPFSLSYDRKVNKSTIMIFETGGENSLYSTMIARDSIIQVWRGDLDNNMPYYVDFVGLCSDYQQYGYNPSNLKITCESSLSLLGRRIAAYSAGTADRTKFTGAKAETVMKALVQYNCTTDATVVNGRKRAGSFTGKTITVETDGANGNTVDWYCAWDNILESITKLADIAGGDFDLVMTSPAVWQFRWYTGQMGTDRSATMIFSVENGTMSMPNFVNQRSIEKTVGIVAGQGEEDDREVVVRTGANYSTTNDIEVLIDARDIELGDTGALEDRGDEKLYGLRAYEDFGFEVIQTSGYVYGRDYFLGDKVKVISPFTGTALTRKITGVKIDLNKDGLERVVIENEPA